MKMKMKTNWTILMNWLIPTNCWILTNWTNRWTRTIHRHHPRRHRRPAR